MAFKLWIYCLFTTLTAKKALRVLNQPKAPLARKKSAPSKTHLPAQAAQPTIKGNSCGTPGREITTLAHLSPRLADVTSRTGLATLLPPRGAPSFPRELLGLSTVSPTGPARPGGTAVPGAPSPAWGRSPQHSPLKHSSRSLLRATVGSPSTSWKSAILRGAKPRASSGLVQATRDLPQSPQPLRGAGSREPPPRAAQPRQGGEGKDARPYTDPNTDLLWCSRDMAAPAPLPRAPHKRSGWKRCPGRGMRDGPRPPPWPRPLGRGEIAAPRGPFPALSPAPAAPGRLSRALGPAPAARALPRPAALTVG